mgnify:CR=1 FL=1
MKIQTIKDVDVKGKIVLLRIDINSPVVNGKILDNPRFEACVESIRYLIKNGARVVVIAHQGRKRDRDFTSLEQHAKILSRYLKIKVDYVDDLFGNNARVRILNLKPKEIIMLRNVREYEDEMNPKLKYNHYIEFCTLFDLYVNEAFSVSHREQGSIIIPPKHLRSVIGNEFESEINALDKFVDSKSKIFILGGSKCEDYFPLFNFLKNKNNKLIAAGVLANLLLIVKGYNLGYENKWLKENGYRDLVGKLRKIYSSYKDQIILPIDFGLCGKNDMRINSSLEEIPFKYKIYDVGTKTLQLYKENIANADYIFMKGPLGFSEIKQFSGSTVDLLKTISGLTKKKKIFSLLGGGHLNTVIKNYKIPKKFSYISLSGGALIQYISGEKLPGIEVLKSRV